MHKLTTFFLTNLLQQDMFLPCSLSLKGDLFVQSPVFIKHFKPIWSCCTASIAKMFEYFSNTTIGKDKNAKVVSASQKWRGIKNQVT